MIKAFFCASYESVSLSTGSPRAIARDFISSKLSESSLSAVWSGLIASEVSLRPRANFARFMSSMTEFTSPLLSLNDWRAIPKRSEFVSFERKEPLPRT